MPVTRASSMLSAVALMAFPIFVFCKKRWRRMTTKRTTLRIKI